MSWAHLPELYYWILFKTLLVHSYLLIAQLQKYSISADVHFVAAILLFLQKQHLFIDMAKENLQQFLLAELTSVRI